MRGHQIIDLQMLEKDNDEASTRLRLEFRDPAGDDTLGMMPPTDLASSNRIDSGKYPLQQ